MHLDGVAAPAPAAPITLVAAGVGVLLGAAWQLQQRELPGIAASAALLGLALLVGAAAAVWHRRLRRGTHSRAGGGAQPQPMPRPTVRSALASSVVLVACAAATFAWVNLRAQARLAERLPAALEGRDIEVTGVVAELPRSSAQGARFVFAVESARADGAPLALPALLSLAWIRAAEPDALPLGPEVAVRAGQRWRFEVRLRQPHGSVNPGGFDLELWLFERGLGATGYVRSRAGERAQLLAEAAGAPVERLRQHLRDAIERRLAQGGIEPTARAGALAGVIAALAIGDQAAIEREDWELFRITGVAHLMSISGLHVTMFAWLAGAAIGALWRLSARAMLWAAAPLAARWGGVAVAALYALVAGWGVPAQRTVWMLAVVALLQSLGLRWPLGLVLMVAAAVVALADPWALLQPGFWLSFVAVALLAASQPVGGLPRAGAPGEGAAAAGQPPWWQRATAVLGAAWRQQAVATVGLAPLTLVFFQQLSLVGFAANLVAIPWVTLVVTPLALLGALLPVAWDAAALALSVLMAVLQWLAAAPHAVWQAAVAPAWAMAAGLAGGLVAILPLPWRLRVLAVPLMLPLIAPPVPRPALGHFEFIALDIGQGTSALVRTRHHLLVYDTGPAYSPEADAGSRLLVPLLHRRGERHIDMLMLSHRDTDHVGGAGAVLAALPVREVVSSLGPAHALAAPARARGAAWLRCEAGQRWQWDGVDFEVLHPAAADYEAPAPRANALSCVLRVSAAPEPRGGPLAAGEHGAALPGARGAAAGGSSAGEASAGASGTGASGAGASSTGAPIAGALAAAGAAGPQGGAPAVLGSVLLTGDIEAPQEAALLARAERGATSLRSQVLLVPHHGSRTSSTAGFIDAVAPELAIVQAGYRSRFGHPVPDVVARYEQRGIALARTDRCGALTLAASSPPRCEREQVRRYWHYWHHRQAPG